MFHLPIFWHFFYFESWGVSFFLLTLQMLQLNEGRPKRRPIRKSMNMQQTESKTNLIADYYSQHYDEVRAFVASRLQQAEETEDIVQNIFLRLLLMDKMITPITLPCLVYTVARNLICDYWRHRQCVEEHEHFLCTSDIKTRVVDAESVYSAQELNEILERGIARLCDAQRKIYRMNICEGMQVSEIALKLDIKYKNVEKRLGAARKEVRKYVKRMLA